MSKYSLDFFNPLKLLCVILLVICTCSQTWAYTLSGVVTGGAGPMAGATVEIRGTESTANFALQKQTTDAKGGYNFSVSVDGSYILTITPPDQNLYAASRVLVQVSGKDVLQDVLLLPTVGQLRGQVSFPGGVSAAGVTLTFRNKLTDVGVDVKTDSGGRYALGLSAGTYYIGVSDCTNGYLSGGCWFDTAFKYIGSFDADKTENISLPYAQIQGKTLDATGQPLAGVSVTVSAQRLNSGSEGGSAALQSGTQVVSDSAGNYVLKLPAGTGYSLVMTDPRNATAYPIAGVGTSTSNQDLQLKSANSLAGTITYPNGSPAIGVQVTIKSTTTGASTSTLTDSRGKFNFGLNGGNYTLGLLDCSMGFLESACWWDDTYLKNIDMSSSHVYDIELPYVVVVGTTVDKAGTAIADPVQVVTGAKKLTSVGGGTSGLTSGTSKSTSNGVFVLELPASANYDLGFILPSSAGGGSILLTNQNFSVNSMGTNYEMSAQVALSGTVTFPNGKPAEGVIVSIGAYGNFSHFDLTTDASGKYKIGLPKGSYDIGISDCTGLFLSGGCWFDTLFYSNFSVTADTVRNVALPYARLSGQTTDRNGVFVAGVVIDASFSSLTSANAGGISQMTAGTRVVSDATGNYVLSLPAANKYQLLISPTQGSNFTQQRLTDFAINGVRQQQMVLPYVDKTPPLFVSGPLLKAINATHAMLEWHTDKPTTGNVSYGSGKTATSPSLATSHSIQLTGLTASSSYQVVVSAVDEFNNGPTTSQAITLTTPAAADSTAPVILLGPTVKSRTHNSMVVEWTTNEAAKGKVSYGVGSPSVTTPEEPQYSIIHRTELTGLDGNTEYQIKVSATDPVGNGPTNSRIISGRTLPTPDTTAPVITNGPLITNIQDQSVTVTWVTDEPAISGVSWNDGIAHGVLTDLKLVTQHSHQITGLIPNSSYKLTVSATDEAGNGPTLSQTIQFETLPLPQKNSPQFLAPPVVSSINDTSAILTWDTDQPSNSIVSYGTNSSALSLVETQAKLTTSHSVVLVNLLPNTTYYALVKSVNAAGKETVNNYSYSATGSTLASFKTLANPVSDVPNFDLPPAVGYLGTDKAVVDWQTNRAADTQIIVTNLSFAEPPKVAVDAELSAAHQLAVTGLKPGNTYRVTVVSTDMAGKKVTEDLPDFQTPPAPNSTAPRITSGPTVETSAGIAILNWTTDRVGDSRVKYGLAGQVQQSAGSLTFTQKHQVVLGNLTPGANYSAQVSSVDPSGLASQSASVSFTAANANGTGGTNPVSSTTGSSTTTTASATTTTQGGSVSGGGAVTTTTVASSTTTTLGNSSLNFIKGWNLVGNGYATEVDVTKAFGDKSLVTTVWKWLADKSAWAFYAPSLTSAQLQAYAQSKSYEVLSIISAGEGFWVNAAVDWTLTPNTVGLDRVNSSAFAAGGNKALPKGWSLIATGDNLSPANFNFTLSATPPAEGTIPLNFISLWAWDASLAGWQFFAPSLQANGTLDTYIQGKGYQSFGAKALTPFTGFWVNKP